jgi:dTDP-4-dehydrorhamnose 3,5-epimerase
MIFFETKLKKNFLITHNNLEDKRGSLKRIFCQKTLEPLLQNKTIRQINHTITKKEGTVRGLHFQNPPYQEIKIVSCLKGKVWDVAVDLRKGSPTFLQHHAAILSEDNQQSFLIPEGFAHGFQTLEDNCEMLYFHTKDYNSKSESVINALDPSLKIQWPKLIVERSERDKKPNNITKDFLGIEQ